MTLLLIGYGNAGRGDDGLGPAFAGRISAARLQGCRVDIDYQLAVEHALQVAEADTVLFVDAMMEGDAPYCLTRVEADRSSDLGSHSLQPEAVMSLAETLYRKTPPAFVLGIAGRSFGEVAEGLSAAALENLDLAEAFFLDWFAASRRAETATEAEA